MANRAYASIWLREFPEEALLENWGKFLATVPHSSQRHGFSCLSIHAVDEAESPIFEQDLRSIDADAGTVVELTSNHVHGDCSYETQAAWDLWVYDPASLRWELRPQQLDLHCFGEDFGAGDWRKNGHFLVDAGFEHFFTGHAGLLGRGDPDRAEIRHPDEQRFVSLMSQPQNLNTYREKTQENIRKLYEWMRKVEAALPVARTSLWSEGEDNFEARVEEILAKR
ncbi:MAG TPA: hypothetical protein VJN21_05960 [Candidatus Acidoferrales bacterium]|nr:hypothetical protein [Candidatus Acidoferrales bacterium]